MTNKKAKSPESISYACLLTETLPKEIESEEEYDRAIALIDKLMSKDENDLTHEEGMLLNLLATLVENYEDKHYPMEKTATPLQMLEFLMEQRDVKPKDLWGVFGAKSTTSQVLSGKRELSKTHIRKLAEFFNVSADLFI